MTTYISTERGHPSRFTPPQPFLFAPGRLLKVVVKKRNHEPQFPDQTALSLLQEDYLPHDVRNGLSAYLFPRPPPGITAEDYTVKYESFLIYQEIRDHKAVSAPSKLPGIGELMARTSGSRLRGGVSSTRTAFAVMDSQTKVFQMQKQVKAFGSEFTQFKIFLGKVDERTKEVEARFDRMFKVRARGNSDGDDNGSIGVYLNPIEAEKRFLYDIRNIFKICFEEKSKIYQEKLASELENARIKHQNEISTGFVPKLQHNSDIKTLRDEMKQRAVDLIAEMKQQAVELRAEMKKELRAETKKRDEAMAKKQKQIEGMQGVLRRSARKSAYLKESLETQAKELFEPAQELVDAKETIGLLDKRVTGLEVWQYDHMTMFYVEGYENLRVGLMRKIKRKAHASLLIDKELGTTSGMTARTDPFCVSKLDHYFSTFKAEDLNGDHLFFLNDTRYTEKRNKIAHESWFLFAGVLRDPRFKELRTKEIEEIFFFLTGETIDDCKNKLLVVE